MNDRLTRNDIKKMEEEIEHRKLVIRKEALEAVHTEIEAFAESEQLTAHANSIRVRFSGEGQQNQDSESRSNAGKNT